MVKLVDSASGPLKRFHKEMEGKADYIHSLIEFRKTEMGRFRNKTDYHDTLDYELSLKIELLRGKELLLLPAELPGDLPSQKISEKDVELLIARARENVIRTEVIIPKKELPYPNKSYMGKDRDIPVPSDFIKNFKNAKMESEFDIYVKYNFKQRKIYQLDSNGFEIFQTIPNFYLFFEVYTSPEESVYRVLGVNPRSRKDINQLDRLIRFIPDVSPEQHLRDATSYEGLMKKLVKIAEESSKNRCAIENGMYDVITPMGTPFHEIFGHHFEGKIKTAKIYPEESNYEPQPIFDERTGGLSMPESLSLIDNPLMDSGGEIEGLKGLRLYGGFDYDLEMFPAERKVLIDSGKITGRMLGSRYADVSETGNAMSDLFSFIPFPRMSILYAPAAKEGPDSLKEMIEMASGKNVLITLKDIGECFTEEALACVGKINSDVWRLLDLSPEAYTVKDGNLVSVKTPFYFNTTCYQVLPNIALSKDDMLYYDVGHCAIYNPIGEYDMTPSSQVVPMKLIKNTQVVTYRKSIEI
jgi:predicted Zn-dependent protease